MYTLKNTAEMEENAMPSQNALLDIAQIDTELESYLTGIGKISYRFPAHDSGCQS